ncbi:uncharacterized protein LDX57_006842 [Aspergillus melleus]|uniref:uncharacterized protein n=1 Tax=Aspergillus melleus TaxID=138277 RepID=UPI001E8CEB74|nr:uncharacterized protein LDX57_006842 [Aspergillus melleus]KAH8429173.1 hypothetical protein LDX57_006842 [Aspergillus melleus]
MGAPEKDLFYCPVEKRRNKLNIGLMRHAKPNLDAFWTAVDRHQPVKCGMTRRNATLFTLYRMPGKLQRTPEWVEPTKKPGPKKKHKARGQATVPETPVEERAPTPQVDTQPTFNFDKRSLKVFSTLFFQPSQTAQPGEVAWNDFLHAMSGTAFSVQKLYGSVWQFSPRNLDVERSIQFHEPHTISKIPFQYARRVGRRLNRTYGWHGGMFYAA